MSQQREGKKADYTASLAMWDAEGSNCQSQQTSEATRQNKETTFPSYIEQNKCTHNTRNEGVFPKYYRKVQFPNQKILSCDMEMYLLEEEMIAGPSQKMTMCLPLVQRIALLS